MPVPVPATPPTAHVAKVQTHHERAIVRQINRMRHLHGLRRVHVDARLTRVARAHSLSMLRHDVLTHSSFDGSSFALRLRSTGVRPRVGETLAWAPRRSGSAKTIVSLWMHSPAHRAVLLDGGMRRVGVGRWRGALGAQHGAAITADFSS
ncbi:MAG TPA: CAP domain-containing protein [Baekduia sp.]|nr:CAP domain-containing protein [Baekduia sp.]